MFKYYVLFILYLYGIQFCNSFHRRIDRRGLFSSGNSITDTDEIHEYKKNDSFVHEINHLIDFVFIISNDHVHTLTKDLEEWKEIVYKYHSIFLLEDGIDGDIALPDWITYSYELYTYKDMNVSWEDKNRLLGKKGISLRNYAMWVSDREYIYFVDLNCSPMSSSLDAFLLNLKELDFNPTNLTDTNIAVVNIGPISYYNEDGSLSEPMIQEMSLQNALVSRRKVGMMIYYNDFSEFQYGDELSDLIAYYVAKATGKYSFLDLTYGSFNLKCKRKYTSITKILHSLKYNATEIINHLEDIDSKLMWKGHNYDTFAEDTPKALCPRRFYDPSFIVYQGKIECSLTQLEKIITNLFTYTSDCLHCAKLPTTNPILGSIFKFADTSYSNWLSIYFGRHGLGSVNYGKKTLYPKAYRSSLGPKSKESTCAFMTIATNEDILLPVWLRNLQRSIPPEDIYIFDHRSTDNSTHPSKLNGSSVINLTKYQLMPVHYRSHIVHLYQGRFLRSSYKCVFFSDTDEIIFVNPKKYQTLHHYFNEFANNASRVYHRVASIEVGHMNFGNGSTESLEPAYNLSNPYIFKQRKYYTEHPQYLYNKPLLTKVPILYRPGFHHPILITVGKTFTDTDLLMIHMVSFDYNHCIERNRRNYQLFLTMKFYERAGGYADHWGTYERDLKSGVACRFANLGYFGEMKNDTIVYDNKGIIPMKRVPSEYLNIQI